MQKGYTPKGKLGTGTRFNNVSGSVKSEYTKKGFSPKKASQIGAAVAAKAGQKKYGAKKMSKMATSSMMASAKAAAK